MTSCCCFSAGTCAPPSILQLHRKSDQKNENFSFCVWTENKFAHSNFALFPEWKERTLILNCQKERSTEIIGPISLVLFGCWYNFVSCWKVVNRKNLFYCVLCAAVLLAKISIFSLKQSEGKIFSGKFSLLNLEN